ncbi:MAG: histidine kinase [Nostoc sp.]|uniref:histidine kinase n=1 Tax=Nostoc sp. TaxID=1180 RepID=UPI002FF5F3E1
MVHAGTGIRGDEGERITNIQCPMPNAPFSMPHAQCPMPNAQCPIPINLNYVV